MQKFTRALTREIEVAGERLAVTLDEKGLSIRTVGSRRPPLELTWAACLCAAAAAHGEPGDAEVARALEAIRGESAGPVKDAKADPPASEESADLTALLERLGAWLKRHRRRYNKGLKPGATDAELKELAEALGRPLPEELADWLRWHNGEDEEVVGAFVESFHLMSTKAIIEVLGQRKKQKGWKSTWVPILDDFQDDLIVVDTAREGLPVLERWQGRDDSPEVAPSLEAWLNTLVEDIEAGRYHEESERGDFLRGDS